MIFGEFCEISKNTFHTEHLRRLLLNMQRVSILDTMKLPLISWEDVTSNTAQSCFAKARTSNYNDLRALVDLDKFFIELRNSIGQLKKLNSKEISNDIFPEEFDS